MGKNRVSYPPSYFLSMMTMLSNASQMMITWSEVVQRLLTSLTSLDTLIKLDAGNIIVLIVT